VGKKWDPEEPKGLIKLSIDVYVIRPYVIVQYKTNLNVDFK